MKPFPRRTLAALIGMALTGIAQAHQPWVLAKDARVALDESVEIAVYFGHALPGGDLMDVGRIARGRF